MRATGRAAADRLKAAIAVQRRGAADELLALLDLVVEYGIDIEEDLIDELLVSTVPGGGEGTPQIHEFVHLELCGLLGLSARQARSRIFETLNLYYRHPSLWTAVQGLQLEVRRACVAASLCARLAKDQAETVGRQWYHQQAGLGWKGAMDLLDRLIVEADPALAAKREAENAATREVVLRQYQEGSIDVTARMDVLDAKYLDATVDQIADILLKDPSNRAWTKKALRAKALGIMATPSLALSLQQESLLSQSSQAALFNEHQVTEGGGAIDSDTGRIDRDPHRCLGHVCGRVSVPPAKLQPRAKVYLHLDATDLTRLGGTVLVEKAGWLSSLSLKAMLGDKKTTIQPVIDLNTIPTEEQYRPSARMREAIQLTFPTEAFPYSHTPSRGLELDHTVAYRQSCRDPQTGVGLLAPLSHTVHHAKTVAAWHAQQPVAGEIIWTSPLGFRYHVTRERTYTLE